MVWRIDGPQCNEAAKIKWELVEYTSGRGLDLGCGPYKTFPHFIGVDNGHHWGTKGIDVPVDTCEKLDLFGTASVDFVFSSHLLEHIESTEAALREWWRVIKDGGYLILYLPHKELYPNCGEPGANPDHKHDFMPADIIEHMKAIGSFDLVRSETRDDGFEYSFFQVYRKLEQGLPNVYSFTLPQPVKTAAVVRYGAFGDAVQTASVIAALKQQGYHITLYTAKTGFDVLEHDPNIDKFVVQDGDQVPNPDLGAFWEHLSRKYSKFVNLSESVEKTLLAMPGTMSHQWPHSMRHKHLNKNYVEFMHDIAEVPYDPLTCGQTFYPTEEERAWATAEREKMPGNVFVWSLAGSAVHKTWPFLDSIIARILLIDRTANIVLVGGPECKLLECGWENESRVVRRSGEWSIRQSLAFAQVANMVIGPETGVLNAVAFEDMPKVVCLSHSSVENLTRDWVNTISLAPEKTSCYPCHKLHYSWEHCNRNDDHGVAQCQVDISPEAMFKAICDHMQQKEAA